MMDSRQNRSRASQSRGSSSYRGKRGSWRANKAAQVSRPPSPPLGPIVTTFREDELDESLDLSDSSPAKIVGCRTVASFNWLNRSEPTIVVPGKPPAWTPLIKPRKLDEDHGEYFRDQNAARYPSHPVQPAVEAVLTVQPDIPTASIDIFACGSTLGNLIRFVRGLDKSFRFLVQVVGGTVFFVRRENSPKELIPDVRGYGHTFSEAYTTWDRDVKGSESHQRILRYQFAGLDCLVRFEADGYLRDKVTERRKDPDERTETGDNHSLDVNLASALEEYAIHNRHTEDDKPLVVKHGGQRVPQAAVFDLKTRSIRKGNDDILAEVLPRFWVAQIPNFILAFHNSGLFEDIQVLEVRDDVQQWEHDNEATLRRFGMLLKKLIALAFTQPGGKLEVVQRQGGRLEVREQDGNAHEVLSNDLIDAWVMGPTESRSDSSEPAKSYHISD